MKLIRDRTTTALIVATALAGGLSACKSHDQYASNGDTLAARSDSAAGTMSPTPDSAAGSMATSTQPATSTSTPDSAAMSSTSPSSASAATSTNPMSASSSNGAWSDAAIVGYALTANSGEIKLGRLAETKATNPAVKSFARMMITDHRAMLSETKALSAKLKVMGDTMSGDAHDLMASDNDAFKELSNKPAGADWDKNYMDKMIDGHQKVLDKLQDAAKNTTNTELQRALEKSIAKVQLHLTKAKDIKASELKA
ncbi:MAG TPA: DUF4142 domain-containing protein [Gemmatimonadaceae bacterium]|jgi:putative membrane protein|nr:DUF4142 domain-containing protein [Gemmatimonadaceae bacterium]